MNGPWEPEVGEGRLFYLMGASGAGKDSLMGYARERLGGAVVFAHRYITRPADGVGENHVWLSDEEFERRHQAGGFALAWRSHGWSYGIGVELDDWLARGFNVVVNGSRAYLSDARRRYPDLVPLLVQVSTPVLAARLTARGREDALSIVARLRRNNELQQEPSSDMVVLRNDGPLAEAGEVLVRLLVGEEKTCA